MCPEQAPPHLVYDCLPGEGETENQRYALSSTGTIEKRVGEARWTPALSPLCIALQEMVSIKTKQI